MAELSDDQLEDFSITYRREIVFHLRQLIKSGERVIVIYDEGRESLVTVLLHIDEANNRLIFDWGGSETASEKLLASERAFFVATPLGVRNQFATSEFVRTTYESRPAFAAPIPRKFIRLQRRQFFRLALPLMHRPTCRFTVGDRATQWELSVINIGVNGIGLETQGSQLPFTIGQVLPSAVIDLGKFGRIETDLDVRHYELVTRAAKATVHMGCRFVALSPAHEVAIQKLMIQVQREDPTRHG